MAVCLRPKHILEMLSYWLSSLLVKAGPPPVIHSGKVSWARVAMRPAHLSLTENNSEHFEELMGERTVFVWVNTMFEISPNLAFNISGHCPANRDQIWDNVVPSSLCLTPSLSGNPPSLPFVLPQVSPWSQQLISITRPVVDVALRFPRKELGPLGSSHLAAAVTSSH